MTVHCSSLSLAAGMHLATPVDGHWVEDGGVGDIRPLYGISEGGGGEDMIGGQDDRLDRTELEQSWQKRD